MCMSAHEMTSAHIEGLIERTRKYMDEAEDAFKRGWQWRIDHYESILKERAEAGTYATAGTY